MKNGRTMTSAAARGQKLLAAVAVCAALAAGGCRHPQARTVPEMPALDVPPPPPRNVAPADAAMPAADSPDRGCRPAPRRSRRAVPPPSPPRDAVRAEPPKPEPVPEQPKPPEEVRSPATTLQTTPADREGRARASSPRLAEDGGRRAEPGRLPQAQRRRAAAIRHRQELHPPGRGCAENEESGLRADDGR